MTPRQRIIAAAAVVNLLFAVQAIYMAEDTIRACANANCSGFNYFGVAAAAFLMQGPAFVTVVLAAVVTRLVLKRLGYRVPTLGAVIVGPLAYWIPAALLMLTLGGPRLIAYAVMLAGTPTAIHLSTRSHTDPTEPEFNHLKPWYVETETGSQAP